MDGKSHIEGEALASLEYPTCWQRFLAVVDAFPENLALASLHQHASLYSSPGIDSFPLPTPEYAISPHLRWTYRTLKTAVDAVAIGLQNHGVREGQRIVTFLTNEVEYILIMLAAHATGCVLAPLNPRQLVNRPEIEHLLRLFVLDTDIKDLIVIAGSDAISTQIDAHAFETLNTAVKIVVTNTTKPAHKDWHAFSTLLQPPTLDPTTPVLSTPTPTDAIILCTSGTTRLPKAVLRTTAQLAYSMYAVAARPDLHPFSPADRILCTAPNNHIAGWEAMHFALLFGGAVVFPGPGFDAQEFFHAGLVENATWAFLAPTMVRALAATAEGGEMVGGTMRAVLLGGMTLDPGTLALVARAMGGGGEREVKVSPVYGCTEGGIIRAGESKIGDVCVGGEVTVGTAAVGQAAKVCEPESDGTVVVALGQLGELVISSPGLSTGYIGKTSEAFIKDDEGKMWFCTGDLAHMDAAGRVFVVGRQKDMIIRGAENISPAAIEAVLWDEGFQELDVQIVGVPDDIAGEVPVAVTNKLVPAHTTGALRDTVVARMGPAYALDEVVSLSQLDMTDYPRTTIGKVQKKRLRESVVAYRQQGGGRKVGERGTDDTIRSIWASALAVEEEDLPKNANLLDFSIDSISVMQVRDRIQKQLGKTLSLLELQQTSSIEEQATLLDRKTALTLKHSDEAIALLGRDGHMADGPPSVDDMVHLTEYPELLPATKEVIASVIQKYGLSWDQARQVTPAYDMNRISLMVGMMNHLNLKIPGLARGATVRELKDALQKVLINNPMLASFFVFDKEKLGNDLALHVVVEQSIQFLDEHIIDDGGVVAGLNDLTQFAKQQRYPEVSSATPPGPMAKIHVFYVEESDCAGFVLNVNHAVCDATFAQLILEDLDAALQSQATLHVHTAYNLWTDAYFTLRSSPAARAAIKYQTASLAGLHEYRNAIWPSHPPMYMERSITVPPDGEGGRVRSFHLAGYKDLRTKHPEITPSIPLKAALVLFLMNQTGHTHALFGQVESERGRWPFLPKSLGGHETVSNLGGQTIQTVANLVGLEPNETVLAFLQRTQFDQTQQTKYANAPRGLVMEALGPDAGPLVPWITNTALFNWLGAKQPGQGQFSSGLELAPVIHSQEAFSFFLMASMTATQHVWMMLKGATFGQQALGEMLERLERLATWLVEEENWARSVVDFKACLVEE